MKTIAQIVSESGHSYYLVLNEVLRHNEEVKSLGYCSRCRKAKSEAETVLIPTGSRRDLEHAAMMEYAMAQAKAQGKKEV